MITTSGLVYKQKNHRYSVFTEFSNIYLCINDMRRTILRTSKIILSRRIGE